MNEKHSRPENNHKPLFPKETNSLLGKGPEDANKQQAGLESFSVKLSNII